VDVEGGEGDLGGQGDADKTLANDVQGVFGGVEQDTARMGDGETAQAGGAGGDGEGEVEGEEGLAALGLPADDADGLIGPEAIDEPAVLRGAELEQMRKGGREGVHQRLLSVGAGRRRGLPGARGAVNSSR
jgi:hypothetical protein